MIIWLVLCLILLSFSAMFMPASMIEEGYAPFWGQGYCTSCGYRSPESCTNCVNCTRCLTPNGRWECVPSDASGTPTFRRDCVAIDSTRPYNAYPMNVPYPGVQPYYYWQQSVRPWFNRWRYGRFW